MDSVEMPALMSTAPGYDMPICKQSIIIEDEGVEFLIGAGASIANPGSGRQVGGTLKDGHYRRLIKALCANLLGAGDHKVNPVIAVAGPFFDRFTANTNGGLDQESEELLAAAVGEIRFKCDHTKSEWQTCRVGLTKPSRIMHEVEAVVRAMPEVIRNALIWQVGFGDWQQCLLLDRKVQHGATCYGQGAMAPVQTLATALETTVVAGRRAWETGMLRLAGLDDQTASVSAWKERAMRQWISSEAPALLAKTRPWLGQFKTCVVSGGLCKDDMFWEILCDELKGTGILFYRINELPEEYLNAEMQDPAFTVVQGLLKEGDLALDPGNGRLKGGWQH